MLAWTLLIASAFGLSLMFVKRFRVIIKDKHFQDNLAEEEALDEEVEEEIDDSVEAQPAKISGSMRDKYLKADMHFSKGEFEEAEPLLLSIIEGDENHLDAHHKLGMIHMKKADFPKAELFFSKLVNLKKDPVYFSLLGAALYQQQRLVEAAEAYENAIALDDKRAARLQSLAQVYFELGDDEKALHYFERASRRKPKDLDLKLVLADYYERLERFEEAVEQLAKYLEADPYNKKIKARLNEVKIRMP